MAAQTPPSAAYAPAFPFFEIDEHNHFGKPGNAATARCKGTTNSLKDFQLGTEATARRWGTNQQQYQ